MNKLSALVAGVLALQAAAVDQVTINPETRMFIDAEGRSMIFHG